MNVTGVCILRIRSNGSSCTGVLILDARVLLVPGLQAFYCLRQTKIYLLFLHANCAEVKLKTSLPLYSGAVFGGCYGGYLPSLPAAYSIVHSSSFTFSWSAKLRFNIRAAGAGIT